MGHLGGKRNERAAVLAEYSDNMSAKNFRGEMQQQPVRRETTRSPAMIAARGSPVGPRLSSITTR